MSKYTTEVRFICEHYAGMEESKGFDSVAQIIDTARNYVFSFQYPIFDENYRSVLETKILSHYYTREICCETVGRWKLFLMDRMNQIMPYYNELYKSQLLEFNPLNDVDYKVTRNRTESGTNGETGSTTNNSNRTADVTGSGSNNISSANERTTSGTENRNEWEYYSDTPQGGINGLEKLNYLTNATHDTVDNSTSGTDNTTGSTEGSYSDTSKTVAGEVASGTSKKDGTFSTTEEYVESIAGKRGASSYADMILKYRQTLINIDGMIIEELSDLFFNLW